MTNIPQQQIPGVYHRRIGDIVVTAISDGFLDGSMQVLRNISVDEATSILSKSFRPARRTSSIALPDGKVVSSASMPMGSAASPSRNRFISVNTAFVIS